jgi:hypothetical protein
MRRPALVPLALLLLVRAGSPLGAALGPRYGGSLTVGAGDVPASLEPADAHGRDQALTLGLVHETLVHVDSDGSPSPALAVRWTSSAEGREWTLWIRPGLRFHDGAPVTSADAVRSLRRFLRGPSALAAAFAEGLDGGAAFRAASSDELPGVSSPGPDRLRLRFTAARPLAFAPLAATAAAVTSPRGAGAGPFVPNLHLPGRRLALIAFGAHWAGRPYLDALELAVGASPEALAADLAAGRLDVLSGGPGASRLASTLLLAIDGSRPPFDQPQARQALDAALERVEIVRLLPGAEPARVILGPGLLPPLPGPRRAALAARLDARAELAVERDVPPLVSQRVVALLSELGLRLDVLPASASATLASPAALRLFAWSPQVPEASLALGEIAALVGAPAPLLEEVSSAALEPDPDRHRARLHRAQEALRETGLVLPLGVAPVSASSRPGVHGVAVDAAGRIRLDDAWVEP